MSIKVGINGFGRIGRSFYRACLGSPIEIVALNDLTDTHTMAHLLKYDSIMGRLEGDIRAEGNAILVNGSKMVLFAQRDPSKIDWESLGVEIVLESTGLFRKREEAARHLHGSVKKVIISAPSGNPDITIAMGVNQDKYEASKHHVLSNASCTTNCLAPIAKVLHENFGIERGLMTTIHSYTNDQRLLDLPHEDLRRARAAALSMIPTTTGAAKAVAEVLPALKGRLDGISVRVPTPNVSLVDFTADLSRAVNAAEVNDSLRKAAEGQLKGIMAFCDEELVSKDFEHNSNSSIVDGPFTKVQNGTMVKVLAWYDNEWGFSCRLRDLVMLIASN